MAKFCTKCGKKLEEGEVCNCTKKTSKKETVKEEKVEKVVKKETPTVVAASPSPANDYVNNYMEVAKGIFTHPIDTMKKFGKSEHFTLGLIMIAINCLVTVLFVYLGFKELVSNNMGEFSSTFGFEYGFGYGDVSIPTEVLVKIFVMMAGGFAGTAAVLYVMAGPVFKTKADIKQLFALVGVCSVLTTITTIVALICTYISTKLMLIVLLVSGVLYLAHLYHGFLETTEVEENKVGYTYVTAVAVATFIVIYLLPKILF